MSIESIQKVGSFQGAGNVVYQNLVGSPTPGDLWFDYSNVALKMYNGVDWTAFSNTTGDITGVTAGLGLSGGGLSGVVTLDLDFSELTNMTGDISGTTEFIIQDGSTESRKAASGIKLSAFNNDSGWTDNDGTVTSIATSGTVNGITLTGGPITDTGTITLGGTLSGIILTQLDPAAVILSSESFADINTAVLTAAATDDRILSYGYSTTTGTVTSIATSGSVNGITLTGGPITEDGTITLGGAINNLLLNQFDPAAVILGTESFLDTDTAVLTAAATDDRILSYGYSTTTGTVTSIGVAGGAGLTSTGGPITSSGTITLAVGAGTGLTVNANDIAITNTGVTAQQYGDAATIPVVTVNAQGQITLASEVSIAIDASQITSGTIDTDRLTDVTLDNVTDNGNTTTNDITVGNLTSTGIDDNATSTAITISSGNNVGINYTGTNADPLRVGLADGEGLCIGTRDQDGTYYLGMRQTVNQWNNAGYLKWEQSGNTNDLTINAGSGDIKFITSNEPYRERMRIDSSGNVGIGTDDPNMALEVSGTAPFGTSDTGGLLSVRNTATGADAAIKLYSVASNAGAGNNGAISFDAGADGTGTTNRLNFTADAQTSTTPMMTISGSGDLNLGVTAGIPTGGVVLQNGAGTKSGPVMSIGGTDTGVTIGDTIGALAFITADASFTGTFSDGIGAQIAAVTETSVGGGYGLSFTTGVTTSNNRAERMRIDYAGNVGIGMSPTAKLSIRTGNGGSTDSHIGFGADDDTYITTGPNGIVVFRDHNGAGANTENMRIDKSGHLGVKTTPSPWRTTDGVIELGQRSSLAGLSTDTHLSTNAYFSQTEGWKAIDTAVASNYYQNAGSHVWRSAPAVAAGASVPWVEHMTITSTGDLVMTSGAVQTTILTTGSSSTAGTMIGDWTLPAGSTFQATYADLAEKYTTDAEYESGTVMKFGGDAELTQSDTTNDHKVAGVLSTNPAYILNAEIEGQYLALSGRVPVKVTGSVSPGDILVSSNVPGHAEVNNDARSGRIIGKAITNDANGVCEALVTLM